MIIDYGCRVKFQSRASIQNIIKCHYPQLPADRMSTPASSVVPSYFQNSVLTCFFTDENISINQLKIWSVLMSANIFKQNVRLYSKGLMIIQYIASTNIVKNMNMCKNKQGNHDLLGQYLNNVWTDWSDAFSCFNNVTRIDSNVYICQ